MSSTQYSKQIKTGTNPLQKTVKLNRRAVIGWREWVGLPDLGIDQIKAKVDTGARTSTLHVFRITTFIKDDARYVKFYVHPLQRRRKPEITCTAMVVDQRKITDSGGNTTVRYVISTILWLGLNRWPVEVTLTNRDEMGFPTK